MAFSAFEPTKNLYFEALMPPNKTLSEIFNRELRKLG